MQVFDLRLTALALTFALIGTAGTVLAQGTPPKAKAAEYPVSAKAGQLDLGAEFMIRLISYERESFVTNDFLVVEVAMFPAAGQPFNVTANSFTLRVNGKKDALTAQTPGAVAASLRQQAWDTRFGRAPFPPAPRAPENPDMPQITHLSPDEVINRSALPEGPRKTSVSGYLFFPWRGNPGKIKTAELMWNSGSGDPVVLRLR